MSSFDRKPTGLLNGRLTRLGIIGIIIAGCWPPSQAEGINIGRVIRRAAEVSDDVPIQRLDGVVDSVKTSRAGRQILEKLNRGKRLENGMEISDALRRAWRETIGESDPAMLRQLEQLPHDKQLSLLVVARGAGRLKDTVPDLAQRARFVREGGAETLAALGRYDELAEDAMRFDLALRGGKLPSPSGAPALTLSDFGKFFETQGDRAFHFWTTYVRPHWKLWLGGAALAAVLLTPDEYLDAAGNLTHDGLTKITRFGGKLLGDALAGAATGTIEAVGEATKTVLTESAQSVYKTFLTSFWGIVALLLLVLIVVVAIPWTRRPVLRAICRTFGGAGAHRASHPESTK